MSQPDCTPTAKHPAHQPNPPKTAGECEKPPLENTQLEDFEWTKCEEHDPKECNCPAGPSATANCLEDLITKQAEQITAADKAKTFKADLEALLAKAKAAAQEYTADKYDTLTKDWDKADGKIADLIRRAVCTVTCWKCVIDCYICGLLNTLHNLEAQLYGDDTLPKQAEIHNLYDVLYWRSRDKDIKERRFLRIKRVLEAWEKPAQTIERILAENWKLYQSIDQTLSDPKAVYDLFLRLIPMHLAIAPPSLEADGKTKSKWQTRIEEEYTVFCPCDKLDPDACCGPDVGKKRWSLRQRLIGPQPYLIHPTEYFDLICCLAKTRYSPAKEQLADAEAAYETAENAIKRFKARIDEGLKNFEKEAKAAIPSSLVCCDGKLAPPAAAQQK